MEKKEERVNLVSQEYGDEYCEEDQEEKYGVNILSTMDVQKSYLLCTCLTTFFYTVTAGHIFCRGRDGLESRRWEAFWGVSNFLFHGAEQGQWKRRYKGMLAAGPVWDMGQEQHRRG